MFDPSNNRSQDLEDDRFSDVKSAPTESQSQNDRAHLLPLSDLFHELHDLSVSDPGPTYSDYEALPVWKRYFQKPIPGEAGMPPPPQLAEVFSQFLYGVEAGLAIGFYQGWKDAKDPKIPTPDGITKQYYRINYFMTMRSLKWGALIGTFSGLFTAFKLTFESYRETEDLLNSVGAAFCVGSLFGMRWKRGIPGVLASGASAGVCGGIFDGMYRGMMNVMPKSLREGYEMFWEEKREMERPRTVDELISSVNDQVERLSVGAKVSSFVSDIFAENERRQNELQQQQQNHSIESKH